MVFCVFLKMAFCGKIAILVIIYLCEFVVGLQLSCVHVYIILTLYFESILNCWMFHINDARYCLNL